MILDEYLKPDALLNNLVYKYKKHGNLVIACDFDRTLYDSKNSGESYEMVRELIRNLYRKNCYIIIWTGNHNIDFVEFFLRGHNIPFHSINQDAPFVKIKNIGRKLFYNALLDDRCGLREVYDCLVKFLNVIDNE